MPWCIMGIHHLDTNYQLSDSHTRPHVTLDGNTHSHVTVQSSSNLLRHASSPDVYAALCFTKAASVPSDKITKSSALC